MKRLFLFPFLIVILAQAACSLGMTPPAPAVTVPAGDQPAAVPSASAQQPAVQGGTALTGTTWMWIGFTGPNDQVVVESPAKYSLAFQPDGSVNITADCNSGSGTYQTTGPSLQVQVGAVTRAMCPAGSRSDEFLQYLGSAASYSFQEGNLYIDLASEGGTLVFAPSTAVTANNSGATSNAILANPWQWTSFASPVQQYDVENPGNYQLTFHDNGTVDIKADCNTVSGTYNMDASRIAIAIGPTTLSACPPGSRSDEFLKYLGSAALYFFQPGELFIDLQADGGTMHFAPVVTGN
ncbi:MAG: META domain-containing protein [Bacteroidota bacterium]